MNGLRWAALTAGVMAGAAASLLWYGCFGRRATVFGRSVADGPAVRGPGREWLVALTFDDGPSTGTDELLDLLRDERVAATFFMCGMNVKRLPGVARRVVDAGHEVGNHTQTHRRLCPRVGRKLNLLRPAEVEAEIAEAQEAIVRHCGVAPRLFRAPYGMRWFGVGRAQRRLGLTGVMWTVIGHDWEWEAGQVYEHVLAAVKPGAIVCLHDGRDTRAEVDVRATVEAVRRLIPELRRRGFGFATVTELVGGGSRL